MEENNFNNETPVENIVVEETPAEVSAVNEPVVEAPMPETKVEEIAAENNIQASVTEATEATNAITTADLSRGSGIAQAVGQVANGVIGVTQVERKVEKPSTIVKKSNKTVAVHSTKNVSWSGVGKVYRGYNIVTPEQAEQWLTRSHIRLATPEEVAKEFGR
ncbi:hypothetical protein EBU71_01530 [bacterium]|nr:hypothetical protein [Candidatus Elulimicrobium humile]